MLKESDFLYLSPTVAARLGVSMAAGVPRGPASAACGCGGGRGNGLSPQPSVGLAPPTRALDAPPPWPPLGPVTLPGGAKKSPAVNCWDLWWRVLNCYRFKEALYWQVNVTPKITAALQQGTDASFATAWYWIAYRAQQYDQTAYPFDPVQQPNTDDWAAGPSSSKKWSELLEPECIGAPLLLRQWSGGPAKVYIKQTLGIFSVAKRVWQYYVNKGTPNAIALNAAEDAWRAFVAQNNIKTLFGWEVYPGTPNDTLATGVWGADPCDFLGL